MKKTLLLTSLILILGSCSSLKKGNSPGFDTGGDAMPLYPVATSTAPQRTLGGHWYIKTVGTIVLTGIEDDDWPYLEFVPDEARFYGTDGCNILNGSYRPGPGAELKMSDVATTMKLCQGDTLAFPIANAINTTAGYSLSAAGDGTATLTLLNAAGSPLMTLSRSEIDYISGPWQVVAVDGKNIDVADARLVFDLNNMAVTGNAGCNRLRGSLSRNPQVGNSLQLSNLSTTRMTCPDIQTETALLIALEEVTSVRKAKGNAIELLDAAGHCVVKLRKLSKSDF